MVNDSWSQIREEILRIDKANARKDHWAVLGIASGSNFEQIKAAHRKWVRKLHPDRWFATVDADLYKNIQEALYQIQVAYFEALKQRASIYGPITISAPAHGAKADSRSRSWLRRLLKKLSLPFSRSTSN